MATNASADLDLGEVEISVAGGPWTAVSDSLVWDCGGVWTRCLIDLSAYAGDAVRIGFHFLDDGGGADIGAGWYVDDMEILEGHFASPSPMRFEESPLAPDPFLDGWSASRGVWEFGPPTSGPGSAFQGQHCAGTVLGGYYPDNADSRLLSPRIDLPAVPVDGKLWLSFWHWFATILVGESSSGDFGRVEISTDGVTWDPISRAFEYRSGGWSHHVIDLSSYAGQTVWISFHFWDDGGSSDVAEGWYIDNVAIVEGPIVFNNIQGFESGTKGWYADNGIWQVGEPAGGAYSGSRCAATVLDGSYPKNADSRLITPEIVLPASPTIEIDHKFTFASADTGIVKISINGNPWQLVPNGKFAGSQPNWDHHTVFLSGHDGEAVRIAFHIIDDPGFGVNWSGWFIDNVRIVGAYEGTPNEPVLHPVDYSGAHPVLTWTNPVGDYDYISIYAGQTPDFETDFGDRIAVVTGTTFQDSARTGAGTYYKIAAMKEYAGEWQESDPSGQGTGTGIGNEQTPTPNVTQLMQNYPNPFNPTTTISFTLPERTQTRLSVHDIEGRLVTTLVDDTMGEGFKEVTWDGKNDRGNPVVSGVYFYRLTAGNRTLTKKMILLK
jgi:hypothetical protein